MAAIHTRHTNKGQTSQKVITAAPGYLLRAVASRRTDDNGEVAQTDRQTDNNRTSFRVTLLEISFILLVFLWCYLLFSLCEPLQMC